MLGGTSPCHQASGHYYQASSELEALASELNAAVAKLLKKFSGPNAQQFIFQYRAVSKDLAQLIRTLKVEADHCRASSLSIDPMLSLCQNLPNPLSLSSVNSTGVTAPDISDILPVISETILSISLGIAEASCAVIAKVERSVVSIIGSLQSQIQNLEAAISPAVSHYAELTCGSLRKLNALLEQVIADARSADQIDLPVADLLWMGLNAADKGVSSQYPLAPYVWNKMIIPSSVKLVYAMTSTDSPSTNGTPGNTHDKRTTESFAIPGTKPNQRGFNAIISALNDTADSKLIRDDEYQLIVHGNNTYTLVLPGVTDLSKPYLGVNPHHRTARSVVHGALGSAGSVRVTDNVYARLIREYALENLPEDASLAIVGHSFGADTALDLAADADMNQHFNITHLVAAGYHSGPQLPFTPPGTKVLVLQNTKDLPVLAENLGHISAVDYPLKPSQILKRFSGGWEGLGHHQNNYTEFLQDTTDKEIINFMTSFAKAGYGHSGYKNSIDVSLPYKYTANIPTLQHRPTASLHKPRNLTSHSRIALEYPAADRVYIRSTKNPATTE